MRKINEMFYSLQGEGFHTGTPALFVRFSGCNLRCPFCDTPNDEGRWTDDEAVWAEAAACPARMVVLTGGEPSLWTDDALIDGLHRLGKYVCIETNGTRRVPAGIDWVTCSPKGELVVLDRIDEVKVVFTGKEDVEAYRRLPARHYFLQPCSCRNTKEVAAYVMEHPEWRLSLQTHKWIRIR